MARQLGTLGAEGARAGALGAQGAQAGPAGTHGARRQAQASGRRAGRGKRAAGGAQARGAHGRGAQRADQGCALGALGLFLTRFDSVFFFLRQIFGHRS